MPEQTPTLDDVFEMLVDMDEDYTCESFYPPNIECEVCHTPICCSKPMTLFLYLWDQNTVYECNECGESR